MRSHARGRMGGCVGLNLLWWVVDGFSDLPDDWMVRWMEDLSAWWHMRLVWMQALMLVLGGR